MSPLDLIAYVTDLFILVSYYLFVTRNSARLFNWANAVGAIPLIGVEVAAHTYPPMVLTVAFGLIGVLGLVNRRRGDSVPSP